jgi:predicted O-linked N-acetylglucosamine transferase (SPINDLY family)
MVNLPLRPPSEEEGQRNIIEFRDYIARLRAWAESKPENLAKLGERVGYSQPYYIAYRDGNHAPTLSLYGKLMSEAVNAFRPQKATAPRTNDGTRKIKLAIVSGFFFRHSAWDVIIKGIVLNIDRSQFELALYYTGTMVDDQTTLAKDNCDLFVQGPKTHKAWMELLSEGGYDAILYSEIGMDPFSMHLACLRLAPLQMLTWGHPMTSGLPTIDWYLSGELLESADADDHYSERLIRLPGTGVCTTPLEIKPRPVVFKFEGERVAGTRCKLYLCQHAFKYTDSAIQLIADIALAVPEADFYVVRDSKYPEAFQSAVDAMRLDFQKHGLSFDHRVYFLPWMNREQFLGSFSSVDIYLDLPGFSGYTTAWQALSQGLPVVTMEGAYLRQRLAGGLLRKTNLQKYIANTNEEYINAIKKLCQIKISDCEGWGNIRKEISIRYSQVDDDIKPIRKIEELLLDKVKGIKIMKQYQNGDSSSAIGAADAIFAIQLSDVDVNEKNPIFSSEKKVVFFDPYIFEDKTQV